MIVQVIDSDRRCPRDHKLMMREIGHNEHEGWTETRHACWSCGHSEMDSDRRTPLPTRVGAVGERLAKARRQEPAAPLVEWVFDSSIGEFRETTPTPDWLCPRCDHRQPLGLDREASLLAMGRHLWAVHPGFDTALLMTEVREVAHA